MSASGTGCVHAEGHGKGEAKHCTKTYVRSSVSPDRKALWCFHRSRVGSTPPVPLLVSVLIHLRRPRYTMNTTTSARRTVPPQIACQLKRSHRLGIWAMGGHPLNVVSRPRFAISSKVYVYFWFCLSPLSQRARQVSEIGERMRRESWRCV